MKTIIVLALLLALAACQSMSDLRPGDGRKATVSGKTYDQVWAAAYKVSAEHFEIREQDEARGVIVGERTGSAWGGGLGAWVGTYITPTTPRAPVYTVEVVRRKKWATNAGEQDWEYKVLRDIYRELGLPALDPSRDP